MHVALGARFITLLIVSPQQLRPNAPSSSHQSIGNTRSPTLIVAHPPRNSPRRTLELVSGAGSWAKVIAGNLRTYNPPALPQDLCSQVPRIVEDPGAWWMGQIVSYLLRPRPDLKEVLDQYQRSLGLSRPLVGMHVRRTDKIGTGVLSAKALPIAKYIRRAQAFWRLTRLEAGIENNMWQEQKVYVASDDPRVLREVRSSYPNLTVLGDINIAKSAALKTRFSEDSVTGMIQDLFMLAKADFTVCSYTSNICRMLFELQQARGEDGGRVESLEGFWFYHFHKQPQAKVVVTRAEGDFQLGDQLRLIWTDQFLQGLTRWEVFHLRTGERKRFPLFSTRPRPHTYNY